MSQIIGGHTFVPLERNIDDVKLNAITGGATITGELISTQTLSTSAVSGDQLLLLKAGGTLARILSTDLGKSISIPSTDAGNLLVTGSDGLLLLPSSTVSNTGFRTFSAISNGAMEVDQRNVGNLVATGSFGMRIDRWGIAGAGSWNGNSGQQSAALPDVCIPGTSFRISRSFLRFQLTTPEVSLAAADGMYFYQAVEGPYWRELSNDVHSAQLLVRSSVAPISFGLFLQDQTASRSLTNLGTISTANTWTLLTFPNLPIWPGAGTFSAASGVQSYLLGICLASGSTHMSATNGTWQTGNLWGAVGQSNFLAQATNSTFDIAYVSHVPGPNALWVDKSFSQAYDEALRYFCKTYPYGTAPGSGVATGCREIIAWAAVTAGAGPISFPKVMAKIPTVTIYNDSTGAAGSIRDNSGTSHASAAAVNVGDAGFSRVSFTTATTASMPLYLQFVADTSW